MMQVEKICFTTHTRNNASHKYSKELGTKTCLVIQVEGVKKIIVDRQNTLLKGKMYLISRKSNIAAKNIKASYKRDFYSSQLT